MNTAEFLTITASIVPDRVALVDPGGSCTYGELQIRVYRMAHAFKDLGLGKGHNVGVMAVNSAEFVELYYASAIVGATFVPLNYRAKTEELTYMIDAASVNVLFISERYQSLLDEIRPDISRVEHVYALDFASDGYPSIGDLRERGSDDPIFAETEEEDASLVIYTSGTTALPKGVVLTHKALSAYVLNTQNPADPVGEREINLVAVPLFHIAGATQMIGPIFSGRTLTILPQFEPAAWLEAVERESVTHAFLVPTMLKRIMEVDGFVSHDISSLQNITYGAAPMPFEVVRQAIDVFECGLMNAYGQTESTSTMTFLGPDDHRLDGTDEENEMTIKRLRSVGRPMPDIDVGILGPDGGELPSGEPGEICIRGERIMREYQGREEETADAIQGDWLHTGDVGYLDADSYLFITGRLKDLIIRGGENIAPAEIEQVLEDHDAVSEAAVIGMPDVDWGEVVVAIVVGSGASDDELTDFVKTHLASYKAPARYEWVDELPRNVMGKVLKNDLRDQFVPAESS
ncbi:MAG: AMP-binding protein [Dehalococcoidia bacterium]|jgi:acyl-CoA synthetase (AMP-forming)/AMP-acid ligase II|nr:AMP-binding protein [Dehalococcoidia bacterium]